MIFSEKIVFLPLEPFSENIVFGEVGALFVFFLEKIVFCGLGFFSRSFRRNSFQCVGVLFVFFSEEIDFIQ